MKARDDVMLERERRLQSTNQLGAPGFVHKGVFFSIEGKLRLVL